MRYAGFWPRLGAMLVDLIVLSPFIALSFWALYHSRTVALAVEVPLAFLFAFYNIYFVGRWGQTIGKMALKVKVVALNGGAVGYQRAFYRHSVDLALSAMTSALLTYGLLSVTDADYNLLVFEERLELLSQKTVSINEVLDWLYLIWTVSELVVLLMNEKRRALHDFIAGTVVIHTAEAPVAA
jgi:uncharacterized RDD family membrane protein YckC